MRRSATGAGRSSTTRPASAWRPGSPRAASSTSTARTAGRTPRRTSGASRRPPPGSTASTPGGAGCSPLVELRAPFTVARDELRDGDRGADDVDLGDLDRAARQIAEAENAVVFHGSGDGTDGIVPASPHPPIELGPDPSSYASAVARAVDVLKRNGLAGPYGLALSREQWTHVVETAEHGGYPLFEHLALILGGPIVWAPGVQGAVVLSLRGGDFLLEVGQDLSIGYERHDADVVELYLEESLSFRSVTPEAAVAIGIAPV